MTFVIFIKFFLAFMAIGSLAVTGWYFITRGEENVQPDGTIEYKGMIFKGWYFFWMKKVGKKKIYYTGEQLKKLIWEIEENYPQYKFVIHGLFFTTDVPTEKLYRIADKWDVHLQAKEVETWVFYKEEDVYRFPEIVRMPLAQCVTCMASIYASIFYWGAVSLVRMPLFSWSVSPIMAAIFFWGVFCFSLSVLNTALVKKFH